MSEHQHGTHLHHHTTAQTAAHATWHCLIGCAAREIVGLAIGVTFFLGVWATIALATGLAYVGGFSLALIPIMKNQGLDLKAAFRVAWLGEVISIAVMEIIMNGVDYLAGGMQAGSLLNPIFWIAFAVSIPPAFLATWPVNYWLLSRELKVHH